MVVLEERAVSYERGIPVALDHASSSAQGLGFTIFFGVRWIFPVWCFCPHMAAFRLRGSCCSWQVLF